ncbi:MAG TPA: maleylpyruvate isomerase family mycothiol-dependent enzyme [Acidimicrobiales bacterium]|jgi:uncharacterized protein (TIGR03083 family)|nr:maleylpyruvate isomerase family mycothiol-dependent enzyme [Acidimicrobiales bacterium]
MAEGPAANEPVIESLEEVWASVVDACQDLDEGHWALPTDCPGWSVQDQLSHLIGVEHTLLGDPAPKPVSPVPPYVKNPIGEMNEAWIEARRPVPGPEVLAEFVDVTDRRLAALRGFPPERFDEIGWSPIGEVPYRDFMGTRVLDSWTHEQDIRRALDRPGGRNGAGEKHILKQCAGAMSFVVGKKVGPPDGTTVLFEVGGALGRSVPVEVEGGRAYVRPELTSEPTVTLTMDQEAFWRLGFGRVSPAEVLASGEARLSGDGALGQQVLESMNFMI